MFIFVEPFFKKIIKYSFNGVRSQSVMFALCPIKTALYSHKLKPLHVYSSLFMHGIDFAS